MSEETIYDCEMKLTGVVISVERLTSKNGKAWAKMLVEHARKYGEETVYERFDISIFGKALEGTSQLANGDEVKLVCRVQADEYKERWYVKLSLKSATVLRKGTAADRADDRAEQNSSDDQKQDASLPF